MDDSYIEEIIKKGGLGSSILRETTAPSLLNNSYVEVVNYDGKNIPGLRIPKGKLAVVHSVSGSYEFEDSDLHAKSMIMRLVRQANALGVKPLGIANVVDSADGDIESIRKIGECMNQTVGEHEIAILNGENAILKGLINPKYGANIFGTVISIDNLGNFREGFGVMNGIDYFAFDPKGQFIFVNSDGVGTKILVYSRGKHLERSLIDSAAMKADDSIKFGAEVKVLWDNVEHNYSLDKHKFLEVAKDIERKNGFEYFVDFSDAGERVFGYNVSGNAVSTISDERLVNPLTPKVDDSLIAIKARGPRSNGITAKREAVEKMFGKDWHLHPEGKNYLEFLSEPSIIFYGVFRDLIDLNLASSFYHMSGGAFKEKLARPLAEKGLFVKLENLFEPDRREIELNKVNSTSIESAYEKYPMGNEGFVTTSRPKEAIQILNKEGLEARIVSPYNIERAKDKTGVELIAYNGETVYFSGK